MLMMHFRNDICMWRWNLDNFQKALKINKNVNKSGESILFLIRKLLINKLLISNFLLKNTYKKII